MPSSITKIPDYALAACLNVRGISGILFNSASTMIVASVRLGLKRLDENQPTLQCDVNPKLLWSSTSKKREPFTDNDVFSGSRGCCKFNVEWHSCSCQIYCSRLPDLGRSTRATLLRHSCVMRGMSRAYHLSRVEGRSLSDGEERPYASMYSDGAVTVRVRSGAT